MYSLSIAVLSEGETTAFFCGTLRNSSTLNVVKCRGTAMDMGLYCVHSNITNSVDTNSWVQNLTDTNLSNNT
jgi:hypothetical protein